MQTLVSLAILKVNWDRNQQDYIENFVPFVAVGLRCSPHAEVALSDLQRIIEDTFGLIIPQGALRTILNRLTKKGYVKTTNGIYRRDDAALEGIDIQGLRSRLIRQQNALVNKLITFCNEKYGIHWSADEAENALLTYITDQAVPLLALMINGRTIPTSEGSPEHAAFIVNKFIVELNESDIDGFDHLATIVKGAMLVHALLFPGLNTARRHFLGVSIYFDTALLLRVLGLQGPAAAAPCLELIELLKKQDAQLRYFGATLAELEGVLRGIASALRNQSRPTSSETEAVQYLRAQHKSPSDIEIIIASLQDTLALLGIHSTMAPPYEIRLGVDDLKLDAALHEGIKYRRPEARAHDLNALTAIHRLRKGQSMRELEDCRAIFVTVNTALVRSSTKFFRTEYPDARDSVPYCILDHELATRAWLKTPLAAPDLPQKQIIADCYAVLVPDDALWKRFVEEIDRLKDDGVLAADQYTLLRHSMDARNALIDLTYNEPDAFAEGTIEQVLERSLANARQEAEAERDVALATLAIEQERTRRTQDEADAQVREAREREERHVKVMVEREQTLLDRRKLISTRAAHYVAIGIQLLVSIVIIVASFFASGIVPSSSLHGTVVVIVTGLVVIFNFLSATGLIFGSSFTSVRRKMEGHLACRIERRLDRLIPLDS